MKYKRIKTLEQYTDYCNIHEKLMLSEDELLEDEIELLELLIEDYDNRIIKDKMEELNPVELLRSLLQDANMTQSHFSKSIGVSKQLLSDVLGYRRGISKELVKKLSNFFSMSQVAFSRNYDLRNNEAKAA